MRDFLLTVIPIFLWVMMVFHLIFFVLLRRRFMDTRNMMLLLTAVISFGLWLNALVLAFGTFMDVRTLSGLNRFSLICRNALIPLLLPICVYVLRAKSALRRIVSFVTILLMVLGIAAGISTVLEPIQIAGAVHYRAAETTPQWTVVVGNILSYVPAALLFLTGIAALIWQKNATILAAGGLMLLFSVLGPVTGNADLSFFLTMFGEIVMILLLYAYAENRFYTEFMEANRE